LIKALYPEVQEWDLGFEIEIENQFQDKIVNADSFLRNSAHVENRLNYSLNQER
jgi:hypothetical protein